MKKEKLGETIIESQEKLESTDATAKVTSVDKAKVNLAKVGNSFKESGADDENKLLTGKVTDEKTDLSDNVISNGLVDIRQ